MKNTPPEPMLSFRGFLKTKFSSPYTQKTFPDCYDQPLVASPRPAFDG
jgi:hypothetical protein